jgi:hypothetical protein
MLLQQLSTAALATAASRNHPLFSSGNEPCRTPFVLDPSIATTDPQTAAAAIFYHIVLGDSIMFSRIQLRILLF